MNIPVTLIVLFETTQAPQSLQNDQKITYDKENVK